MEESVPVEPVSALRLGDLCGSFLRLAGCEHVITLAVLGAKAPSPSHFAPSVRRRGGSSAPPYPPRRPFVLRWPDVVAVSCRGCSSDLPGAPPHGHHQSARQRADLRAVPPALALRGRARVRAARGRAGPDQPRHPL